MFSTLKHLEFFYISNYIWKSITLILMNFSEQDATTKSNGPKSETNRPRHFESDQIQSIKYFQTIKTPKKRGYKILAYIHPKGID